MKRVPLLRTQRNRIFELIRDHGLDPTNFNWETRALERAPMGPDQAEVDVLVHKDGHFAEVDNRRTDGSFWVNYSPSVGTFRAYECCSNFQEVLRELRRWATALREELDAPDFWGEIEQARAALESVGSMDEDAPWSEDDAPRIRRQLERIEILVEEAYADQVDLKALVHRRMIYLEQRIETMSRADWLHTAIGVLFTIAFSYREGAADLFRLMWSVLQEVLGLPG